MDVPDRIYNIIIAVIDSANYLSVNVPNLRVVEKLGDCEAFEVA